MEDLLVKPIFEGQCKFAVFSEQFLKIKVLFHNTRT